MIYLRLAGGLGNQLFQLAAAVLLSKRTKQKVLVLPDALNSYATARTPDSLRLVASSRILSSPADDARLKSGALKWLITSGRLGRWFPALGINDKTVFPFEEPIWPIDTYVMDGYFQSGWAMGVFHEAIEEFTLTLPIGSEQESLLPGECLIHIRGGDFLSHALYQVVNERYYVQGIRRAQECGWTRFAVVTDDVLHASNVVQAIKQNLPGVELRVVQPAKDLIDDFWLLNNAPARIIGNSTFAWWATALDTQRSATWSPSKLLLGQERDFYLNWESKIEV